MGLILNFAGADVQNWVIEKDGKDTKVCTFKWIHANEWFKRKQPLVLLDEDYDLDCQLNLFIFITSVVSV